MTFTPKYGQPITGEQAAKFREIRSITGKDIPEDQKQNPIIKAANSITDFIGARGIAEQYGTSIAEGAFRLGGNKQAADIVAGTNPSLKEVTGSALQTGSLLVPGGAGRGLLAKVGLGATAGQMIDTGSDLQEGASIKESLKPGIEAAVGANVPFVGEAYKKFGKLIGKTGEKIQFSTIKPTQADIKDGFSVENINKYDLGGSLNQSFKKTEQRLTDLSRQLDEKLVSATEQADIEQVFEKTAKELLDDNFSNFGVGGQIGKQIESLGDEVARVTNGVSALPIKDANTVKRAAGHLGAWQYGVKDADATAREKVYSAFYRNLKEEIENKSPEGVKELNKQMSDIIPVMNALIRRIPVAERNNIIGLGEIMSLSQMGYNPSAGFLTLATLAGKSSKVGEVLQKTGTKMAGAETAPLNRFSKFFNLATNQQETQ